MSYFALILSIPPNSDYERIVLKAIAEMGLPLPDQAQEYFPNAQCKPDFTYKKAKLAIFCDGSVHDDPQIAQRDRIQRENFEFSTGYKSFTFDYKQDLIEQVNSLKSLLVD